MFERWKLGQFCSNECKTGFIEEEARLTEQIVQELRRHGPGAHAAEETPPPAPLDPAEAPFVQEPAFAPLAGAPRVRGVEPAVGPRGNRGVWQALASVVVERSNAIALQGGELRRWARAIRIESGAPTQVEEDAYLNTPDRPVLAPELRPRLQRPRLGLAGLGAPVSAEFRSPQWRLPQLAVPLDTPRLGAAASMEDCALLKQQPSRSGLSPMAQGRFLREHPIRLPVEPPALEATEILTSLRAGHWSLLNAQASPGWLPENVPLGGVVYVVQLIPLEPRQEPAMLGAGIYGMPPQVPGMGAVFPPGYSVPPYLLNQINNYAAPAPRQYLPAGPVAPPPAVSAPIVLPAAAPPAYAPAHSAPPPVTVIPAWAQALTGMAGVGEVYDAPAPPARRGRKKLPSTAQVMSWADLLPEFAPAVLDWPAASKRPAFIRAASRPLTPKNRRPLIPSRPLETAEPGWPARRAPVELLAGLGMGTPPVLVPERLRETQAIAEVIEIPRAAPRWGRDPSRAGLALRRPPLRVRLHAVADSDLVVPGPARRMAG